jgi:hypothetical protein
MRCANCGFDISNKKHRSNPQNAYFHSVVLPIIAEHTGYTVAEVKDLVKSMFLRREMMVKTKNGVREVSTVMGSSELTTAEFEKLMSDIRQWSSSDLGLFVPEPNETLTTN